MSCDQLVCLLLVSVYTYSSIPLGSLVSRHDVKKTQYLKIQIINSVHKKRDKSVFQAGKGYVKEAQVETGSSVLPLTLIKTLTLNFNIRGCFTCPHLETLTQVAN